MLRCPNCGRVLSEGGEPCSVCRDVSSLTPDGAWSVDTKAQQLRRRVLPIVLGLIALVLVGGGVWYFLTHRNTAPEPPAATSLAGRQPSDSTAAPDSGAAAGLPDSAQEDDGAQVLQAVMQSDAFLQAEPEVQAALVEQALQQLSEEGVILPDYEYAEDEQLFSFSFTNGAAGGVCLHDLDYSAEGAEEENSYPEIGNASSLSSRGLVLNGFEATSFRRDFYHSMRDTWSSFGGSMELDEDVTVDDFRRLDQYDFVVFAMHGYHYRGKPILSLEQPVTAQSDAALAYELLTRGTIAKVYCSDNVYHYWIMPGFFSDNYSSGKLTGVTLFSESCCFYGCDCGQVPAKDEMGRALTACGASAVLGYHNSVGAVYSRDVIFTILFEMAKGSTLQEGLAVATGKYGPNDDLRNPARHKYEAYPVVYGNQTAMLRGYESLPRVWSDWSDSIPDEITSPPYTIEERTLFRTSSLETTTAFTPTLSGWELHHTEVAEGDEGVWSSWSDERPEDAEGREIESRTVYRYRDREDQATAWPDDTWETDSSGYEYGEWTEWSDTPHTGMSQYLEFDEQEVEVGTEYLISHYCTGYEGRDGAGTDRYCTWPLFIDGATYHELGWFSDLSAFRDEGQASPEWTLYGYYPNGSSERWRCTNTCYFWYITDTRPLYRTQYRWRTAIYMYYQHRWGSWSDWSDTAVSPSETREVESRTEYHYRDPGQQTFYVFQRWGDWTEYSTTPVSPSDTLRVETKTQYRWQ